MGGIAEVRTKKRLLEWVGFIQMGTAAREKHGESDGTETAAR
jgi:hypothetical protein